MQNRDHVRRARSFWLSLLAVCVLGLAAPVAATPVNVWFETEPGFGVDAASANAFAASGGTIVQDVTGIFANPSGGPERVNANAPQATFSFDPLPAVPSKANPIAARNDLGITPQDQSYQNLWLVFLDEADPFHNSSNVGLQIDGAGLQWILVSPEGFPTIFYPAVFVGDVAQGVSAPAHVEYRVAEALEQIGVNSQGGPVFKSPVYSVAFLSLAVPEPGSVLLLGAALTGLALRRRRR